MGVNDFRPYFDLATFYLLVAENQEPGSFVFRLNDIDKDSYVMISAVRYSLELITNHSNTFIVNQN